MKHQFLRTLATGIIISQFSLAFAASSTDTPLMFRLFANNPTIQQDSSHSQQCEVYADKVVVTTYVGEPVFNEMLKTVETKAIQIEGNVYANIAAAASMPESTFKEITRPLDSFAPMYAVYPEKSKDFIMLDSGLDFRTGKAKVNPSIQATNLIKLIDLLCPVSLNKH